MEENYEYIIMQLITHAGDARSYAMQAIREARKGNFDKADEYIKLSQEQMVVGHKFQTQLIVSETSGEKIPVSLLMIHAQDHVMNAMTVKDLAVEMIGILKEK